MSRLKNAWNVFVNNRDPTYDYESDYSYGKDHSQIGPSYSYRPDRPRLTKGNERSLVTAVYNRIAMDCAAITIQHVRLDENNRFKEVIDSGLNRCLTFQANIDQSGREFIQDAVLSMLDEGCVALVPVDTSVDPNSTGSFKINTLRTGRIVEWYPAHIKVNVYDERDGRRKDIIVPKATTAIIENPLYAVTNEPNSTMRRLVRKLVLLDAIDEQSGSGKLDIIVQLPYAVKGPMKKKQAEDRKVDLEDQLFNSKYGVAYIDAAEHVTQLNRPVENNLMKQVEYLTNVFYSQLGFSQSILDGTASEQETLNYYSHSIEPILSTIVSGIKRAFFTRTALSEKQSIMFFRDPFALVPVEKLAELVDKFTRNEVMSTNEFRPILGMKPADDPKADQLINKNINQPEEKRESFHYEDEKGG